MVSLILLVFGLVMFLLAGFWGFFAAPPTEPTRLNLVAIGLACWIATEVISVASKLPGH